MKMAMVLALCLVMSGGAAPAADLTLDDEFPVVGRDQVVSISGVEGREDLNLWVIYSPNSATQTEVEIGRFSTGGTIAWNPERFGIATLSARDSEGRSIARENVAVLFERTPVAGMMVMIFAGLLLFGGAGFSLRSVLRSGVPEHGLPIDT